MSVLPVSVTKEKASAEGSSNALSNTGFDLIQTFEESLNESRRILRELNRDSNPLDENEKTLLSELLLTNQKLMFYGQEMGTLVIEMGLMPFKGIKLDPDFLNIFERRLRENYHYSNYLKESSRSKENRLQMLAVEFGRLRPIVKLAIERKSDRMREELAFRRGVRRTFLVAAGMMISVGVILAASQSFSGRGVDLGLGVALGSIFGTSAFLLYAAGYPERVSVRLTSHPPEILTTSSS